MNMLRAAAPRQLPGAAFLRRQRGRPDRALHEARRVAAFDSDWCWSIIGVVLAVVSANEIGILGNYMNAKEAISNVRGIDCSDEQLDNIPAGHEHSDGGW